MNKVILMGRLTREPSIRYSQGENPTAVCRYTLAVERHFKYGDEVNADFISCVAFGKQAEVAKKYFYKGIKLLISGHIQTGSYVNTDGIRIPTTDVVIEEQEFAESKTHAESSSANSSNPSLPDGFMNIPDGIDEKFPFQ